MLLQQPLGPWVTLDQGVVELPLNAEVRPSLPPPTHSSAPAALKEGFPVAKPKLSLYSLKWLFTETISLLLSSQLHDRLLKWSDIDYFSVSYMQLLPFLGALVMSQELTMKLLAWVPRALRWHRRVISSWASGVTRSWEPPKDEDDVAIYWQRFYPRPCE